MVAVAQGDAEAGRSRKNMKPASQSLSLHDRLLGVRDSILSGRTDGALVRLVSRIAPGETAQQVDDRLAGFIRTVDPIIPDFVPN